MGIERLFGSLHKEYNAIKPYNKNKNIKASHILFDFNAVIHTISAKMISNINTNIDYKEYGEHKNTKEYIDYYNDNFSKILIKEIQSFIIDLITNMYDSSLIKYILIAIDGVPSKGKIIEQKKRRYLNDLISTMVGKDNEHFYWSKNNISPATDFMVELAEELSSDNFKNEIDEVCYNFESIIVSNADYTGEGEMKIVEYIKNTKFKKTDKIYVYSPDADMILLLMLINKSIKLNILRYNQQLNEYNIIDIQEFKKELVNLIKINLSKEHNINDNNVIQDIVFIFTILGDDFIPKLETINTSDDIKLLLEVYILSLLKTKTEDFNYIIILDKVTKLNKETLLVYFKHLQIFEKFLLKRNFNERNYKNAKYVNKANLALDIRNFEFDIMNVLKNLKNNNESNLKHYLKKNKEYQKLVNDIVYSKDIKYKYFKYNIFFMIDRQKLFDAVNNDKYKDTKQSYKTKLIKYGSLYIYSIHVIELIYDLVYYYMINNELPIDKMTISNPNYSTKYAPRMFSSQDNYNKSKIDKMKPYKQKEHKILNRLDEYYAIFNSKDMSRLDGSEESMERYYKYYFKENIEEVCNEYINGLLWIFQYYYNSVIDNSWVYKYTRTPLIKDIVKHLEKTDIEEISTQIVKNSKLDIKYTQLEHFIYVSPLVEVKEFQIFIKNKEVTKKLKEIIKAMPYFFPDIKDIAKKVVLKNDEIDCSHAFFMSKCHLTILDTLLKNDKDYISKFRKIFSLKEQQKYKKLIEKFY
jgi:5'-3' exonuclease